MKNPIKYFALLLAILFVITGTVMVASAEPDASTDDEPGISDTDPDTGTDPDDGEDPDTGGDPDDSGWYSDPDDYDNSYDGSGDAGSVADSNTLIDPAVISDADIAPNAWSNISIDSTNNNDSSKSFASIKTDDRVDPHDHSVWFLWLGYALIALSLLGILYFIVATMNARKITERARRHDGVFSDDHSASDAGKKKAADSKKETRSAGHHADSQSAARRSSKADTGEIYVPRRASKK